MRPTIDFVVVANHAEAQNGLLYLMGAGFTDLFVPPAPEGQNAPVHIGIGISMVVPWSETNKVHALSVWIENEDGQRVWEVPGISVEVGRAPGLIAGSELRPQMAINAIMPCPPIGGYRVGAELAGHTKTSSFRVSPPPGGIKLAS